MYVLYKTYIFIDSVTSSGIEGLMRTSLSMSRRGSQPLYVLVKDGLINALRAGRWRAGEPMPTEIMIAAEFGVSQGTARKAIDDLVAMGLVVRRQGKGTFVSTHSSDRSLFHFFHLVDRNGERVLPESRLVSCRSRRGNRDECGRLGVATGARITEIRRIRSLGGAPAISETVLVATEKFPDLAQQKDLPNTLYRYYEDDFGISVTEAEERLSAIAADADDAAALGVAAGTPLLLIERTARTLDGQAVELRISRCRTDRYTYLNILD